MVLRDAWGGKVLIMCSYLRLFGVRWLAFAAWALSIATPLSAATLDITVVPEGVVAADQKCLPAVPTPCAVMLKEAVDLIQQPAWQQALAGHFDSVRLQLTNGTHRLQEPLALRWGQGLTTNIRLELAGQGAATVVTGAQPVLAWRPVADGALGARLAPNAHGKLWVADVAGMGLPLNSPVPRMTDLFYLGEAQPLASWPNTGYGRVQRSAGLPATDKTTFAVAGRNVADWLVEPDIQAFAYWFWDWDARSYPVATKDVQAGVMGLAGTGSVYGIKNGQRLRIENALIELDSMGEWYLDRASAKLYFWPPTVLKDGQVELSIATSLLHIEDSANITIRNLTLEKTRGDAVVVRNSSNVVLDSVSIRNTGSRALVIAGGSSSGLRNGLVEHTGTGGVSLSGGDRNLLTAAGHFVENSQLRDFSRFAKTYSPAVGLDGVGQRVVGNVISDAPHVAIMFQGNDHLIANNEIVNVVKEASDMGAIYTGRDFTARGTVIENNFLHDIQADTKGREVKGVYLDDQASGVTVRNNVFARVQQPVFIGGGRDHVVEGNVFYDSSPAIHLDARGLQNASAGSLDPKSTLQTRLDAVPYRDALWAGRYAHMATIREDDIGAPKYNVARRNVVVKGKPYSVAKEAAAGIDLGGLVEQGEEVFAKPVPAGGRVRREDFELKPVVPRTSGKDL